MGCVALFRLTRSTKAAGELGDMVIPTKTVSCAKCAAFWGTLLQVVRIGYFTIVITNDYTKPQFYAIMFIFDVIGSLCFTLSSLIIIC